MLKYAHYIGITKYFMRNVMSDKDWVAELEEQKKYFNEDMFYFNCNTMEKIVIHSPELRDEAFAFWSYALKSGKLHREYVGASAHKLVDIVEKCPETADSVFELLSDAIKENHFIALDLTSKLPYFLKTKPEYANKVFSLYKEMITCKDVYGTLMSYISGNLENIAEQTPNFSGHIISVLNVGYDKYIPTANNYIGNRWYDLLEKIACSNHKYSSQAIAVIYKNLCKNKISSDKGKEGLMRIAKNNPETAQVIGEILLKHKLIGEHDAENYRILFDLYKFGAKKGLIKDKNVSYYKLKMKNKEHEYSESYIKVSDGYVVEQVIDKRMGIAASDVEESNAGHNIFKCTSPAPYIVGVEFSEDMAIGKEFAEQSGISYEKMVYAVPVSAKEYALFKKKAKTIINKDNYEIYSAPKAPNTDEDPLQAKMDEMIEKLSEQGLKIGKTGNVSTGEITTNQNLTAEIQMCVAKSRMKGK